MKPISSVQLIVFVLYFSSQKLGIVQYKLVNLLFHCVTVTWKLPSTRWWYINTFLFSIQGPIVFLFIHSFNSLAIFYFWLYSDSEAIIFWDVITTMVKTYIFFIITSNFRDIPKKTLKLSYTAVQCRCSSSSLTFWMAILNNDVNSSL